MSEKESRFKPGKGFSYVELPSGIFTADGVWFHTTEEQLQSYAPDVLHAQGLERLLKEATTWTRLPVTLATLATPALLIALPVWEALILGLGIFMLVAVITPMTVLPSLMGPVRFVSHPIFQGLIYVAILSYLARVGQIDAVWAGLAAFLLLRWGVVEKLTRPIVARVPGVRSRLSVPDQILRGLIVRYALRTGSRTPELQAMEDDMIRIMHLR